MEILQPKDWKRPKGYSNGIIAEGKVIFISGQIGWNANEEFVSDQLVPQIKQALENITQILAEANAKPEHVARLTWYVTDKKEYLNNAKEIGAVYREIFGLHFPTMSLVQVAGLLEDKAKVEIEATGVITHE